VQELPGGWDSVIMPFGHECFMELLLGCTECFTTCTTESDKQKWTKHCGRTFSLHLPIGQIAFLHALPSPLAPLTGQRSGFHIVDELWQVLMWQVWV
jgi:hypothetical protein